jgi:hypothetical protein
VADDHGRALLHAGDALREAPAGSRCLVHRVMLSFSRIGYFYEALVARGRLRRGSSGTVVWEALPAPGVQLAPLITDARETIGDSLPPEAIAAGLADLELHQERLRRPGRAPAER